MSEFVNEGGSFEGRQVPMDGEAERYLLGGILRDPNVMTPVIDVVSDDDFFYLERHQLIWRAMRQLYSAGTPIDMLTLPAELEKMGRLQQSGGREYIFELMESVASSANVEWNLEH
ncbi:MAG: replicative DNA helicase, partial [Kiritimatiellae bacterium]|nr:replicative DNA helicase [Kiritimatiellia bacterium]